jgi:hypothetical protein
MRRRATRPVRSADKERRSRSRQSCISPFQGIGGVGRRYAQGVALGCIIPAFQAAVHPAPTPCSVQALIDNNKTHRRPVGGAVMVPVTL